MNLLFVTEFFPANSNLRFTGGVESYGYYLTKELSKRHKIIILCRDRPDSSNNALRREYKNLKVIKVGPKTSRIDTGFLTIPGRFLFIINGLIIGYRLNFDIVQGNNFITYPLAFMLGFFRKKPAVAWYPDVFIGKWFKITGFLSGVMGEVGERISLGFPWSKFIALSETTKAKLISKGVPSEKIQKIYAGVDVDFFRKIKSTKKNTFTICCISRLIQYKRIDLIIKAVKIIQERGFKVYLNIVGTGPNRKSLDSIIQKNNLSNSVHIEQNLSRLALGKRIKSSHILCLPSEEEGFGLVIIEAAACGVPYVACNIPAIKEITKNGTGGLLFKKGDEKDLAKKILIFIKDAKLLIIKKNDLKQLIRRYSWPEISQQFEAVYEKLLHKQLKILMLIDAWFPHIGGGQVHVWELSKKLADKGLSVEIFTRDLGQCDKAHPGVKISRVGFVKEFSNILGRLEYLFLVLFKSMTSQYDIWHGHAFSPGLLAPLVKFFKKAPTVFTVHGKGYKIAGLDTGGKFLEDLVFYKIPYDLEITVARKTIEKKAAAKKLVVIPNGVDIDRFKKAIRERVKIKRILYVGRLSYEKGVDLLIDAFKSLNSNLSLKIIGDGPEKNRLTKKTKKLKVKFSGNLEGKDLTEEYKKADLMVLPSRTEGQPLTLFEAWASQLPVLATRVGDNEKFIEEGIDGFLADPNAESLKEGLEKIVKVNRFNEITRKGYQKVKNYTWEKTAQRTLEAYYKIYEKAQS